jgi:hypothetical protein
VDWDELKDKFCLVFFPMSRIGSLPRAILDFEQNEKESIGAAWARFSMLIHVGLDLSLPDGMILRLFCLGLDIDADLCLDVIAEGHFTHKTMMKQVEFLKKFRQTHFFRHKNQTLLGKSHVKCGGVIISRNQAHTIPRFDL